MKRYFISSLLFVFVMVTSITAQENTDVFKFKTENFEITTLSEGQQKNGSSILIDATSEMIKKYAPDGTFPSACNAFLVKTPEKTVLIDAGFGRNLFANLKLQNITSEKIDIILLTHMHGDHIGGLLKDGKVTFPNAQLYIAQAEYDYWMNIDSRGGEQARSIIQAYKNKLHLFVPADLENTQTELLNGISAIAVYGHTPGHTAYLLKSDNLQFLIWGDLAHAMAIQMPHPEIAVTYDVNPEEAVISRKKILEYAAENKIPVAGMHIAFPAMGHIKRNKAGGYEFEPLKK
ncbi:MAG: MBL fold metallo-hydrolase [Prevotellaceae bacterium]|jgi:glyoxylase-like metal-dependent hydrolase (beta-lactamase superfamily II)|nr:MBL fold metallo-hydrolase [Prevotellaceae bacterium]